MPHPCGSTRVVSECLLVPLSKTGVSSQRLWGPPQTQPLSRWRWGALNLCVNGQLGAGALWTDCWRQTGDRGAGR